HGEVERLTDRDGLALEGDDAREFAVVGVRVGGTGRCQRGRRGDRDGAEQASKHVFRPLDSGLNLHVIGAWAPVCAPGISSSVTRPGGIISRMSPSPAWGLVWCGQ